MFVIKKRMAAENNPDVGARDETKYVRTLLVIRGSLELRKNLSALHVRPTYVRGRSPLVCDPGKRISVITEAFWSHAHPVLRCSIRQPPVVAHVPRVALSPRGC